jgi:hypothetical protein
MIRRPFSAQELEAFDEMAFRIAEEIGTDDLATVLNSVEMLVRYDDEGPSYHELVKFAREKLREKAEEVHA